MTVTDKWEASLATGIPGEWARHFPRRWETIRAKDGTCSASANKSRTKGNAIASHFLSGEAALPFVRECLRANYRDAPEEPEPPLAELICKANFLPPKRISDSMPLPLSPSLTTALL